MMAVWQMLRRRGSPMGIALVVLLSCWGAAGCDAPAEDEDELLLSLENRDWVEIDLGEYSISVLIADDPTQRPDLATYQESVALSYRLHCWVAEEDEELVRQFLKERHGEMSDEIIRTCRHANLIDLADPELQLIRSHLRDFSNESIGDGVIKRFIFSEVELERY